MSEIWAAVCGYVGRYEVSNLGRVRSLIDNRSGSSITILSQSVRKGGYLAVHLRGADGSRKQHFVHLLVLRAFEGPAPAGHESRHLDGRPNNNRRSNLRWATHQENMDDQIKHGTRGIGSRHSQSKLTEIQVLEARTLRASGVKLRAIAARYKMSISGIHHAINSNSWRHI